MSVQSTGGQAGISPGKACRSLDQVASWPEREWPIHNYPHHVLPPAQVVMALWKAWEGGSRGAAEPGEVVTQVEGGSWMCCDG